MWSWNVWFGHVHTEKEQEVQGFSGSKVNIDKKILNNFYIYKFTCSENPGHISKFFEL